MSDCCVSGVEQTIIDYARENVSILCETEQPSLLNICCDIFT